MLSFQKYQFYRVVAVVATFVAAVTTLTAAVVIVLLEIMGNVFGSSPEEIAKYTNRRSIILSKDREKKLRRIYSGKSSHTIFRIFFFCR